MTSERNNPSTWPDAIHFTATGMIMTDHLIESFTEEWNESSPEGRKGLFNEFKRLVLEDIEEQLFQAEYKLVLTDDDDNVLPFPKESGE
jgi:hypothetical protein